MLPLFWVAIGICFRPISLFLNRFYSRISSLVLFIELQNLRRYPNRSPKESILIKQIKYLYFI